FSVSGRKFRSIPFQPSSVCDGKKLGASANPGRRTIVLTSPFPILRYAFWEPLLMHPKTTNFFGACACYSHGRFGRAGPGGTVGQSGRAPWESPSCWVTLGRRASVACNDISRPSIQIGLPHFFERAPIPTKAKPLWGKSAGPNSRPE